MVNGKSYHSLILINIRGWHLTGRWNGHFCLSQSWVFVLLLSTSHGSHSIIQCLQQNINQHLLIHLFLIIVMIISLILQWGYLNSQHRTTLLLHLVQLEGPWMLMNGQEFKQKSNPGKAYNLWSIHKGIPPQQVGEPC